MIAIMLFIALATMFTLGCATYALLTFNRWKEVLEKMATLEEQLGEIKGILEKANTEITNELVKLNQRIADLEASLGQLTPEQQAALDAVKAVAVAIDDKIPDVPA
jgi:hypothetical protein